MNKEKKIYVKKHNSILFTILKLGFCNSQMRCKTKYRWKFNVLKMMGGESAMEFGTFKQEPFSTFD